MTPTSDLLSNADARIEAVDVDPERLATCWQSAVHGTMAQLKDEGLACPDWFIDGATRIATLGTNPKNVGGQFRNWLQEVERATERDLMLIENHPVWDALVQHGFDPRWNMGAPASGLTVLHACCHDDLDHMILVLGRTFRRHGLSIDVHGDRQTGTPLFTAVRTGGLLTFKALMTVGANPLATNEEGSSLHAAVVANKAHAVVIVRQLLGTPLKTLIDVPGTITGTTPLYEAVQHGRVPMVQTLLDHGADPRCITPQGDNVRMLAHRRAQPEVCRMVDQRWSVLEQATLRATLDEGCENVPLPRVPLRRL